ncbi:MAG TPA: hydrogenase maturation protease [Armatimonadetes bacterium]|nr:hydrogenase maturation protease [Armatimonadota bacterium]
MESQRVVVLGVGNLLLRDEGIGVHLARALQAEPLPKGVEVIDGGTAAWEALDFVRATDWLIILDAVRGGGAPGTVYRFRPEDVLLREPPMFSLHQLDLWQALQMAELLGRRPREVRILGIEPKEIGWGLDLSEELQRRWPLILERVREEIEQAQADLSEI